MFIFMKELLAFPGIKTSVNLFSGGIMWFSGQCPVHNSLAIHQLTITEAGEGTFEGTVMIYMATGHSKLETVFDSRNNWCNRFIFFYMKWFEMLCW
jgi:hypothetical protein